MIERAVKFGRSDGLIGVLAEPAGETDARTGLAVLFWNAGLLHRVGPCRMYVDLARELAALGFPSLRFDLSGVGDSVVGRDQLRVRERAVSELQAAMTFVSSRGSVQEFVLVGLCSGADNAHAAAVSDPRVCGLVSLDGYAYPTWRFRAIRVASFLADRRRVLDYLRRKGREVLPLRRPPGEELIHEHAFDWTFPPRRRARHDLQDFLRRGMKLLYIYSGEMFAHYNYDDQFRDMFRLGDRGDQLQYAYLKNVDHLFSLPGARERLVAMICEWMQHHFGSGTESGVKAVPRESPPA